MESRMKKTPKTTSEPQPVTAAPAIPIPPQAAALAMFSSPGAYEIPPEFLAAWSLMPRVVVTSVVGESEKSDCMNRYACARAIFDADVARSRGPANDGRLARVVDVLEAFNPDSITD